MPSVDRAFLLYSAKQGLNFLSVYQSRPCTDRGEDAWWSRRPTWLDAASSDCCQLFWVLLPSPCCRSHETNSAMSLTYNPGCQAWWAGLEFHQSLVMLKNFSWSPKCLWICPGQSKHTSVKLHLLVQKKKTYLCFVVPTCWSANKTYFESQICPPGPSMSQDKTLFCRTRQSKTQSSQNHDPRTVRRPQRQIQTWNVDPWLRVLTFQTERRVTSCRHTSTANQLRPQRHTPNLNFPIKSAAHTLTTLDTVSCERWINRRHK